MKRKEILAALNALIKQIEASDKESFSETTFFTATGSDFFGFIAPKSIDLSHLSNFVRQLK
jgi:hypothetical protein